MNVDKLVAKLHPFERKLLPFLTKQTTLQELISSTELKEVEAMRGLQWLQNKKLITLEKTTQDMVHLGPNGKKYLKDGLPEKQFLHLLDGKKTLSEMQSLTRLAKDELNACIGQLRAKNAVKITKGKQLIFERTKEGDKLSQQTTPEEKFLQKKYPFTITDLKKEEKKTFEDLKRRKNMLLIDTEKTVSAQATKLGKQVLDKGISDSNYINKLTPEDIDKKTWNKKKFRAYDVDINVPKISGGKRHFVNEATNYARRIWQDMGFQEMSGPIVNTSFWNFDALFTAQDHPVRELQDTFFVKSKGKLPSKNVVSAVKKSHETGVPKSKGWGYKWSEDDAKTVVLRTHTTVLSAKTLANIKQNLKDNIPSKYFAIGKCFRNEAVDWSHLFEFNQTEGIVVDKNANFRHLLGYLKQFFKKMGYPQARFRPAYFPYTEPSVEIDVYHPKRKTWIELGGAGIFRPEVVIPLLGEDVPVLAWGPGIDRILTDYYNIQDLRDLYKNDLKQIKETKAWLK